MTFWPLTSNSDFSTDPTFHQVHDIDTELDLHRITSGFHGTFATGVAFQWGTLTLPDTWFRPPFQNLLMLQLLRPVFLNMPYLFLTLNLEYHQSNLLLYYLGIPFRFFRIQMYLCINFTELWVVSMEHLQRVWLASRERLPFRTPGSVPHFGTC